MRVICIGAVVLQDAAVLMVRQSPGHNLAGQWTIPWGRLEAGETPSRAAAREALEEAGVTVSVDGLIAVQALPDPWTDWLALIFRCRTVSGAPKPDGVETDDARYFTADDLANFSEPVDPWCRWLVTRVLQLGPGSAIDLAGNPYSPSEGFFVPRSVSEVFAYVWEFEVPREREAEFERHYGPAGTWVQLFSRSPGYLGTLLLKDREKPGRYVTVDRWESEAAYRAFRVQYASEYQALDLQCENLTSSEKSFGNFAE